KGDSAPLKREAGARSNAATGLASSGRPALTADNEGLAENTCSGACTNRDNEAAAATTLDADCSGGAPLLIIAWAPASSCTAPARPIHARSNSLSFSRLRCERRFISQFHLACIFSYSTAPLNSNGVPVTHCFVCVLALCHGEFRPD